MIPLSEDLQKEYALRFSKIAAYRNEVWKVIVGDFLQRRIGQGKDILDLGCGWGEFINNVQAGRKYGMDLNPDSRARLAPGITFLQQDCSQPWALPDESLDLVFTSNFFEHLPTKQTLLDTLRQAYRCLRPGGRIMCLGPNMRHVSWAYWDFFDHHLPLSHLSLTEVLRMVDLVPTTVVPRFLPYTMADGKQPPLCLVKAYLHMPVVWPLIGKQFFVVAEKPAAGTALRVS